VTSNSPKVNSLSEYLFKVPFVGDGGVGKTSFVLRYVQRKFFQEYKMTIGVDFQVKSEQLPDGTLVKVQLWDTGGQERFTSIRSMYYRGSSGFVFLFDVTNRRSFENLDRWFDEIYKHVPDARIVLIGNKIDLASQRVISTGEGQNYALSKGVLFAEASAKTGEGVSEAMRKLLELMVAERGRVRRREPSSKEKQTVHPALLANDEIILYEYKG
jgi:small GTP-binding protein